MSAGVGGFARIGVLGCGLMGSGIAEVCARSGAGVVVVEADDDAVANGRKRVIAALEKAVASGRLDNAVRDDVQARIAFSTDIGSFSDRQLVIEAVPEVLELKLDAFRRIDAVVQDPEAVLASNTSSMPVGRIAAVTRRPEQVLGVHFFNPVPLLPLVELVTGLQTSEDTVGRARAFAEGLGKKIIVAKDRAGFVINALLIPYMLSAIRMVEAGHASADDIDTGMVAGCAHPIGPLKLTDLVGLDTTLHVANSLYEEFKEPLYAPPPLLLRMVDAGMLGRKSGRGFYDYN